MLQYFNYKHNKTVPLPENTVVNGQGRGQVRKMRYGFFPMSYNGCEMIAIHNSMVILGEKSNLAEVCLEMYPKCQAVSGVFGSVPVLMGSFYKRRGIPCRMTLDYDDFFDNLDKTPVSVISFWNPPKKLWNGIHTVTVKPLGGGKFRIYNRTNGRDYPCDYDSRQDFMKNKSFFICGYLLKEGNSEK